VPAAQKRHRVFETQDCLPLDEMMREALDWLEARQGKVTAESLMRSLIRTEAGNLQTS
jgi:hypothetical protein